MGHWGKHTSLITRKEWFPSNPSIKKGRPGGFGSAGFTLVEMMVAVAVLAVVAIPLAQFFTKFIKAFFSAESRSAAQDIAFLGETQMIRDFREMNEVVLGAPDEVVFLLDNPRLNESGGPGHSRHGNPDGDSLNNELDPDDDGDALVSTNTIRGLAFSSRGWRYGLDLNDDDDDNDGKRDVQCRYRYDPAREVIERQLNFNETGWRSPDTIFQYVKDCQFDYFGHVDAPNVPPGLDADGNQLLEWPELWDGVMPLRLDTFPETRFIGGIDYQIAIQSPRQASPFIIKGRLWPLGMEAKEKFP